MVQIKPADADRFLARPDPAIRVVLIYGNDEGLVSERVRRFADAVVGKDGDPLAHVRLDSAAIADDPGRLADEANAIPLFGGNRAISIKVQGNRSIEAALGAVLAAPPVDAWIVIAAGELRKTAPLRKLCEIQAGAAAVPCYADQDRDLDRLIDEETKSAGLTIAAEARTALKALIGSDRLISRSEVQKLCLYAADAGTISLADVRVLVGDAGAFAVDETIDALALGDSAGFDRGYRRLIATGTPGFVVAGAALRHFNFLQKARAALDAGRSAETLVQRAIPPIFFSRQRSVAQQIARWSPARIERALTMLDQAMLASRLHGNMSDDVIGQTMQLVATLGVGSRRQPA
jgi:DNA polymerase-3 subunit delta